MPLRAVHHIDYGDYPIYQYEAAYLGYSSMPSVRRVQYRYHYYIER